MMNRNNSSISDCPPAIDMNISLIAPGCFQNIMRVLLANATVKSL
jgi:hypothetical protein